MYSIFEQENGFLKGEIMKIRETHHLSLAIFDV